MCESISKKYHWSEDKNKFLNFKHKSFEIIVTRISQWISFKVNIYEYSIRFDYNNHFIKLGRTSQINTNMVIVQLQER